MNTIQEHTSVAVLGAGSIGLRHLKNLRTLGVKKLACFEPDAARRELGARELSIPFHGRLESIWDFQPEAVVIAAPTQFHLPLVRAVVDHGLHLFVEKPLAHVATGLASLVEGSNQRVLVTMVACNMRFHPGPAAVKRLLDEGRVGRVLSNRLYCGSYLPRWRPWQDYRLSYSADPVFGGAILDCIHEIDLALWYLGPARLRSAAVRHGASLGLEKTCALAELLIDHAAGALGSVHLNFVQRNYSRGCELIGERGTIRWDFGTPLVHVYGEDGALAEAVPLPADYDLNTMYLEELKHFLGCVQTREQTCNPLAGGLAALQVALDAQMLAA